MEERDRRERGKRHEGPSFHHTEVTDSTETDISFEKRTLVRHKTIQIHSAFVCLALI